VSANHCCRVVRAADRRAARLDRSLPPHNPASAVEYNSETPSQKGLPFADFPNWHDAWERIESPIRRAYHLTGLLTGARPGELARLKWSDVRPHQRSLVISHAKAGADIAVPMSIEIAKALRMARGAGDEGEELVFPGCAQVGHRDELPARGNMLRHTFRTVCADLGVDELLAHFLMGHAPEGISQKYIARMILTSGPALRAAQRKVSRRITALLNPTARAPVLAPDAPQDAPQAYREATFLPALP
jgi:integrase